MGEQHANSYLSNVSTFTAHVRSCDNLKVRLVSDHSAIVVDTSSRINDMDERVLVLNQIDLLFPFWADDRSDVLVSRGNLGKSTKDIELRNQ